MSGRRRRAEGEGVALDLAWLKAIGNMQTPVGARTQLGNVIMTSYDNKKTLLNESTYLNNDDFVIRMLYKDSY